MVGLGRVRCSLRTRSLRAALAAAEARAELETLRAATAEAELAQARALASATEAVIKTLRLEIAKLRREQYGKSSERRARLIDQLELQLEELEAAAAEDAIRAEKAAKTTRVRAFDRRKPARKPFPEHLPRERVVVEAPAACSCCGSSRIMKMGEDVTETLEIVPRRWKVIQTVRETRIDALFDIERELNGLNAEARREARQRLSRPLVEGLRAWLQAERAQMSRHADVAKAIDYMFEKGRWPAFTLFLDDGRICLTNNCAERALRGVALGRKSWLFAGSERGGDRAAFMYTLIVTAKLNDIDPQAWLADVLARMPNLPVSRLPELLPWELAVAPCGAEGSR